MRIIRSVIAALLVALTTPLVGPAQTIAADLIIVNGNVRTMDAHRTVARALAVWHGRIIAVGSDSAIRRFAGDGTKVIDAGGKLVLPGFNDAHVHLMETGMQLSSVDLRSAKSPQEFVERIHAFASKLPKGQWVLGGDWDHENWTPNDLPTAALVDAATPDNPVFVSRLDGHMALANTLAMKLAGVTSATPDMPGGIIVRDRNGSPTGIFKDSAEGLIERVVPEPTFDQRLAYAQATSNYAAAFGVTSFQDMSAGVNASVYQELLREGKLKTRVYGCSPLVDYKRIEAAGIREAFGSSMVRIGCLKGYADGSLGSTTAWFFAPYLDAPNSTGVPRAEVTTTMKPDMIAADKDGLQVMVHAIGDRANATILDYYKEVDETNGPRDRRYRIEHAQHLRPQDIPRFGRQHIVASMQPLHLVDDGRWAWKRLDAQRLKGTYAFRTLLDTGATLAFGSDSPVASMNPLLGIYAAVTRRTADGKNPDGWMPEQKITVDEAVRAFTYGSAYAEFQENFKGQIEPGKAADLIILSDDIFTIDPIKIADARVLTTILDGRIVFERDRASQ